MGEVVQARTSPTLPPHPLALCCNYAISKCPSASIVATSTLRVNCISSALLHSHPENLSVTYFYILQEQCSVNKTQKKHMDEFYLRVSSEKLQYEHPYIYNIISQG